MMLQLHSGQRVHIIGIGGAGLSAIARILLERGFTVSGSDLRSSALTADLAAAGARIHRGHQAAYVVGADVVLATSAAAADHVEALAAQTLGIPVYKRKEFMPALLCGYETIAVAGTHGKTTTTSMIIHILQSAGKDPSFIVGGATGNSGRNAGLGAGSAFVIEADEYDNMFHGLRPNIAVVTNVEHDHPDFFKTPAQLQAAFRAFVDLLPADGLLVACADEAGALALAAARRKTGGAVITYGLDNATADWRAGDLRFTGELASFSVQRGGQPPLRVELGLPGTHNMQNALAALIVAQARGVALERAAAALRAFKAPARRFQIRGERAGVIVVDDYAHHPTEIRVNIDAARRRYPQHQIWAVWQPHTYSRVRQFWSDFATAFAAADRVLLTPIYAAREAPIAGISSAALAREIAAQTPAAFCLDFDAVVQSLRQSLKGPAILLIFSAGDANIIADKYLAGH